MAFQYYENDCDVNQQKAFQQVFNTFPSFNDCVANTSILPSCLKEQYPKYYFSAVHWKSSAPCLFEHDYAYLTFVIKMYGDKLLLGVIFRRNFYMLM